MQSKLPSEQEIRSLINVYKRLPQDLRNDLVQYGDKLKALNDAHASIIRTVASKVGKG